MISKLLERFLAHPFRNLAALITILVTGYFVVRAVYRVTFHPLVRFPGPKLRAISHLPHAFSGKQGRQPYDVRELHKKYGPVVRICPNQLSFITPSSWEDIHGHAATKKLLKYGYFKVRPDAQPMLTTSGDEHTVRNRIVISFSHKKGNLLKLNLLQRQRSAFAHGFSQRAISDQESTLAAHVDNLVNMLEQKIKQDNTFDVGEWMRFLAFDIIGDFTLNTQFECVKNQRYHPWVALLMNWFRAVSFVTNANAFGQLAPFIMLFAPIKHLKSVKDHLDMSAHKVRERLAIGDDPTRNDLWTYLLRNKGDKALSLGEMEVNAALFIIAATEPLSDVLCGTIYFLALYPEIREKLRAELKSCMGSDDVLNMANTARSPYLHAVINESMRMYPPIPGGMRRKTPPEGHTISGIDLPPDVCKPYPHLLLYTSIDTDWHPADRRSSLPTRRLHSHPQLRPQRPLHS
jgi:hypothetical protein